MKKLLLALLLVPTGMFAQKWQVGVGGGIALMSQPSEPIWLKNSDVRIGPCFHASLSKDVSKKFRAGISVSVAKLFVGQSSDLVDVNANPIGEMKSEFIIGRPSIIVMPFIEMKWKGFYAGLQAGIFTTSSGSDELTSEKTVMYYGGKMGFGAGLHFGYEHRVAKRISVFIEPRFNYMRLTAKGDYSMNFIEGQACAGVKISL